MAAMVRTNKWIRAGVPGAIAIATALLIFGAPGARAQMGHMNDDDSVEIGLSTPGFLEFCAGDPCPGQTCDNVNARCVGTVTLQPPAGAPLVGLTAEQLDRFAKGKDAFSLTLTPESGLGPIFNQDSCASCHSAPIGGSGTITVTRFGNLNGTDFDPLADLGGSLWNREAISAECAEVIPVPPTNFAARRLTNSTLGFGLVEAILDADIEINDINPPAGISGRSTVVPVLEDPGATRIGRFGWKLQLGTVESFTSDAMLQEMGFTSRIFPEDNAPNNDPVKLAACDTVADPEDAPDAEGFDFLDRTTDFQRFLAPPPQTPRDGMSGEAIFNTIGCADCHMRTFVAEGDDETEDAIRGKSLYPYSDFLLHDMAASADFIEQGQAGITEIRTTPLWGLQIRDPLWHDGRVAGGSFDSRITGAVALHDAVGSEAEASAQQFAALSADDRNAVTAFLFSLGRREFDMDGDGVIDEADVLIIDDCAAIDVLISPDDECAIADVDQDGDVDQEDLDLLAVVLGIVDGGDDEDEDEDGDGGVFDREDFLTEGRTDSGQRHLENENSADSSGVEATSSGRASSRRSVSRRGL